MASRIGGSLRIALLAASGLVVLPACGETFVSSTGAGGAGTGGSSGAAGGVTSPGGGGGAGGGPTCGDGDMRSCYTGPAANRGIGVCTEGKQKCSDGTWGPCEGSVLPAGEICDGQDNDCKGDVDEGCPCAMGESCFPYPPPAMQDQGPCQHGVVVCENGQFKECLGVIGPVAETCNGVDDNCDGTIDNVEGAGNSCTTGIPGICSAGTKQCKDGGLTCMQSQDPLDETCNNKDDDCDGTVDNIEPTACELTIMDPGNAGSCDGVQACVGGAQMCARKVFLSDDFHDLSGGWSFGSEWSAGATSVGPAPGQGNPDPAMDHSPTADNAVAGVAIGGNFTGSLTFSYMTSKPIETAGFATLYLSYWRWLNADGGVSTPHKVEVSIDNMITWVNLWSNTDGPVHDDGWIRMVHEMNFAAGKTIRVRFGFAKLNMASPSASGWNIDDLTIGTCPAPSN